MWSRDCLSSPRSVKSCRRRPNLSGRPKRISLRDRLSERLQSRALLSAMVWARPAKAAGGTSANDIQPGSRDSMLLKGKSAEKSRVDERPLAGEDVPVERVQRPRKAATPQRARRAPNVDLVPDADMPSLPADVQVPSDRAGKLRPFAPQPVWTGRGNKGRSH